MSVSIWQDHKILKNSPDQDYDVVIIGGGIAGLSSAYWLLKENEGLRIALVEKGEIGEGASGRNAGFITCGSVEHFNRLVSKHGEAEAQEIWKFSEVNLELLQSEIIKDQAEELGFEKKGSFSLASTKEEFSELKKSYELMSGFGIDVEVLEENDIKSRLGADGFVGGIKYVKDASINPMKLLHAMKDIIIKDEHFTLLENHEV